MAPKLYARIISPPCRAVLLTANALNLNLDYVHVNFDENLAPEFIKLNPQHTVPTLVDDGEVIWDSHAINVYLIEKYSKDDSLYPKEPYQRAVINQRLHFDSGVLFPLAKQIRNLIVLDGIKTVPQEQLESANEVFGFLEKFLGGNAWFAGDNFTLADLTFIPTVTALLFMVPVELKKFPKVSQWLERIKTLSCYRINQEGHAVMEQHFLKLL